MICAYAASYGKPGKPENEDAFTAIDGRLYVVSDGVSRSPYPALASRETVAQFRQYFGKRQAVPDLTDLEEMFREASAAVHAASVGSCATVTSLWIPDAAEASPWYLGVSVGDSRLYGVSRRGEIRGPLTSDHIVREFDTVNLRWRTLLSATCGGLLPRSMGTAVVTGAIAPYEGVLLATDGAWRFVETHAEDVEGLFRVDPEDRGGVLDLLTNMAAASTQDDATMILVMNDPRVSG